MSLFEDVMTKKFCDEQDLMWLTCWIENIWCCKLDVFENVIEKVKMFYEMSWDCVLTNNIVDKNV